jgi:antitoxin CptB
MSEINKLKWQCRRSMKELEILFMRYLEQKYEHAPIDEQQTFQTLLELPDIDLYTYLVKREMPTDENVRAILDDKMQTLVEKMVVLRN